MEEAEGAKYIQPRDENDPNDAALCGPMALDQETRGDSRAKRADEEEQECKLVAGCISWAQSALLVWRAQATSAHRADHHCCAAEAAGMSAAISADAGESADHSEDSQDVSVRTVV